MRSFTLQTTRDKSRKLAPTCMWSSASEADKVAENNDIFSVLYTDTNCMLYYARMQPHIWIHKYEKADAANARVSACRIRIRT